MGVIQRSINQLIGDVGSAVRDLSKTKSLKQISEGSSKSTQNNELEQFSQKMVMNKLKQKARRYYNQSDDLLGAMRMVDPNYEIQGPDLRGKYDGNK